MNLVCLLCGKSFEGEKEKFCSDSCSKSHIADISRRTAEDVKNDPVIRISYRKNNSI